MRGGYRRIMATLLDVYRTGIVPELMNKFGYKNEMSVPKLQKIVVTMRISSDDDKKEALEEATTILSSITGQIPSQTKARKSVSGFRVREGDVVGCITTLRGARMYEFLERLIHTAIPRVRDFRGLKPNSFDGSGNYNMGVEECIVFPEINPDELKGVRGMNVTIVTSSRTDDEAAELLRLFGMPFKNDNGGQE
jgi:large subunit ribosomal protein L5